MTPIVLRIMRLVLAVNAGSSSLKASILKGDSHVASFLAERLGTADAVLHLPNETKAEEKMDHAKALKSIIEFLRNDSSKYLDSLVAIGHRVVHGGEAFSESALIDESVIEAIEKVSSLAPL